MAKTVSPAQRNFTEQLVRSAALSKLVPATLTAPEAAKLFGFSEDAIRNACDTGELDCLRIDGGHRRIPLASLIDWAAMHREVA